MSYKIIITDSGFKSLPDGKYLIMLKSFREEKGNYGRRLRMEFKVMEGEYEGCPINAFVNTNKSGQYSSHHKLSDIVSALSGTKLKGVQKIDLEVLVGHRCYGHV